MRDWTYPRQAGGRPYHRQETDPSLSRRQNLAWYIIMFLPMALLVITDYVWRGTFNRIYSRPCAFWCIGVPIYMTFYWMLNLSNFSLFIALATFLSDFEMYFWIILNLMCSLWQVICIIHYMQIPLTFRFNKYH